MIGCFIICNEYKLVSYIFKCMSNIQKVLVPDNFSSICASCFSSPTKFSRLISIIGSWCTWATTNWLSTRLILSLLALLLKPSSLEVLLVVEVVENLGFWENEVFIALKVAGTVICASIPFDSFSPKNQYLSIEN